MANISTYLKDILSAVYGRDVRQSIHDGIEKINEEVESNVEAEQKRVQAEESRKQAEVERENTEALREQSEADREQTKTEMNAIINEMNEKIASDYYRGEQGIQGVGIGLTPKGKWVEGTYVLNDWVVHNGVYWWCKAEETTTEPSQANSDWEKLYEMSAETPIQFEESEDTFSFKTALSNVISGSTLGNLFTYIKSAFLKLFNKFSDTEYTETGTSITYDSSNDSSVVISDIETSASDCYVVSENGNDNLAKLDDLTTTYFNTIAKGNIVELQGDWSSGRDAELAAGTALEIDEYKLKIIPVAGSASGDLTVQLWYRNSEYYFELAAEIIPGSNEIVFSQLFSSDFVKISVIGEAGLVISDYAFILSLSKTSAEHKASGTIIPAGSTDTFELYSYEGTTNILTTSSEQVSFTANFKSRFWKLNSDKIDKKSISKDFATTNYNMVAAAPLVKELKEETTALNASLDDLTGNGVATLNSSYVSAASSEIQNVVKCGNLAIAMLNFSVHTEIPVSGTLATFPYMCANVKRYYIHDAADNLYYANLIDNSFNTEHVIPAGANFRIQIIYPVN